MSESLRLWFLASEAAPFAKTGGLADVAGSLPNALKKLGVDVRVGLPYYRMAKEGNFQTRKAASGLEIPVGNSRLRCDVLETSTVGGVPVYLFDREDLFDRPNLYGTPEGDYYDNLERFTFFSHAALLFPKKVGFNFDVVHCHDWQTGLIPAYVKTLHDADSFFSSVASVFTIHNIGYQGLFPPDRLHTCGMPLTEFNPDGLEFWGKISLLKAGIVYTDAITTVSPRYSQEIQTNEFGMGLDGILKKRASDLYGILNGADYSSWNPAKDRHLTDHYSLRNIRDKQKCKAGLVKELGLHRRFEDRPVLGMVSRLAVQKGADLLAQVVEDIVKLNAGLVILGAGEEKYQALFIELGKKYPGSIAVRIGFDETLAHRIMAGSDMLLVPSRYEPCGLTQIYGLKYGTVPIVRATGGLDDTIEACDAGSGKGTGFKFSDYDAKAFLDQIRQAIQVFENKPEWVKLIKRGMREDFSWEKSAGEYVSLYEKVKQGKKN